MTERNPDVVTMHTLHEDLTAGFTEMRAGFTQLDLRIREQHSETQQVLHALALIARIDALIRGRSNGEPAA